MKHATLILGLILSAVPAAAGANASDLRMTVQKPHFTCEGHDRGVSTVAWTPDGPSGAPLPCCDGKIGCAQFLSTNTIIRQKHEWRS